MYEYEAKIQELTDRLKCLDHDFNFKMNSLREENGDEDPRNPHSLLQHMTKFCASAEQPGSVPSSHTPYSSLSKGGPSAFKQPQGWITPDAHSGSNGVQVLKKMSKTRVCEPMIDLVGRVFTIFF